MKEREERRVGGRGGESSEGIKWSPINSAVQRIFRAAPIISIMKRISMMIVLLLLQHHV